MNVQPLALQSPDPNVWIRPVQTADAERLHVLFWSDRPLSSIYQFVSRAQQFARQGRGLGVVVMGRTRDELRGYGQLTLWHRTAEISDLVISEAYRGQGLGTALIQYLVRAAREMHAPMVEIGAVFDNSRALALYRRLGFEDSHTVKVKMGSRVENVLYLTLEFKSL